MQYINAIMLEDAQPNFGFIWEDILINTANMYIIHNIFKYSIQYIAQLISKIMANTSFFRYAGHFYLWLHGFVTATIIHTINAERILC